MRITRNVVDVLEVLVDGVERGLWGYEISARTGIPTPTVYGVLARLEHEGLVSGFFEEIDESAAGRPARRLYELTPSGRERASVALEKWRARREGAPRFRERPA